jgi:hypothetical protein
MRLSILLSVPLAALAMGCEPVIIDGLDGAILSVRAVSPDDVWLFGADDGDGPTLMSWDGSSWERHDTSDLAGHDLWWGQATADRVFLAGSGGLVGVFDRSDGTIEVADGIDEDLTFFGVWGATADDVWAVGGGIGTALPPAVQRWDGTSWSAWEDPAGPGPDGGVYFKVHGSAADDVWIVGNQGTALRWDGTTLADTGAAELIQDDSGNAPSLLTIDVGATPVAVGGAGQGVILHWDESTSSWTLREPEFAPGLLGVCSGPNGALRAVGGQGSVYDWDGSTWNQWERGITFLGLHGCLIDDDGGFWTGGGSIAAEPLVDGILIYDGPALVKQP